MLLDIYYVIGENTKTKNVTVNKHLETISFKIENNKSSTVYKKIARCPVKLMNIYLSNTNAVQEREGVF